MPLYDRQCESCGWQAIDLIEPVNAGVVLCHACGEPTVRAWFAKKAANVIGDEMDHIQVNGLRHPRRFRSKSEHRRWIAGSGWTVKESHPTAGGKQWLSDAEELAKRQGGIGTKEPEDEPLHVTWSTGELTPTQVEEYRAKNR